jgi:hypothetical protein
MSNEIRILVYEEMKERLLVCTEDELARDFIIKNCYRTDSYGSLVLEKITGWIVLDIPPKESGPRAKITSEHFEQYEDALVRAKELYPSASTDWIEAVCYNGITGFNKMSKKQILEENKDERIKQMVNDHIVRITDKIKSFIKKYNDANVISYLAYPNPEEAEADFMKLVERNNMSIGDSLRKLRKEEAGKDSWYLLNNEQWNEEKRERGKQPPAFPKIPTPLDKVANLPYDDMGFLIHFYDYFFNETQVSIAHALAIGHKEIWKHYEGAENVRKALDSNEIIGISENSNFRETILSMAQNGFDMQPIIDSSGNCVGSIRIQDVIKMISERGLNSLPIDFNLNSLKHLNLLLPIPPLLDSRAPLADAENILKSGSDGILIRFDPETWWGQDSLAEIKMVLKPGLHIITSHDIAAYHLSK